MHSHIARKRFGQNFLIDQFITERIISAIAPQKQDNLAEIGPGLGALTDYLCPLVNKLDLIEIDRDLVEFLQKKYQLKSDFIHIHQADALKFKFQTIYTQQKIRVVGNLPYNISTPLLFHLLDEAHIIEDMIFMLQEEVVDRLVAQAGEENYGRLSIMTQYYCRTEKLFSVPPTAFKPAPKVQSAIVKLIPHTFINQPVNNITSFSHLVSQAFSQRRKTIRNTLKNLISAQDLEKLALDPQERAENLTLEHYIKIAQFLERDR